MSKDRTRTTGWKRLVSGALCLVLLLGMVPTAGLGLIRTASAAHWAEPYAQQLVEWGVMNPSSNLRLNEAATRAEFVAMCNRAFGYKKLGGTPFTDVPSSAWYAQDIDIAYNAGYFKGTSATKASPTGTLTREQAAVLLARNLMLQETVGESLGFTDSRTLHEWSRGLIAAAANEGIISGYTDGSYRPFNNITRGELAAMLVRAIGHPVNTSGSHRLGDGTVYGNVIISKSNVTLRDTIILGNLYITGGVDLGNVLLENVTVLGRIVVSGGGVSDAAKSSVILRNVEADELVVDSMVNQFVTISTYGYTDIDNTYLRSTVYLEDSSEPGYGLSHIELVAGYGTEFQLAGSIQEVINMTPGSTLRLVKGTAKTITIDEYATNSELILAVDTRVEELNLDVATLVTGKGDIGRLNIGANGCEIEILPEEVNVRAGVTATLVDDEGNKSTVGSAEAAELSSEPRLMAGYPKADSLRPTSAEGLFMGNKPGTIYWAVSEIADGSVSVEHLLKNPPYGGNILKDGETAQAGSIDASSKTEYGRLISGLEPDGSYYISAILVDALGNRSPLKVMSFNTPDDTVPAFVEGYPYMSRITCEIAQVTAMTNKSCMLYWVLLPHGAAVPTPQNFRTGAFGGSYGYGSQSVVKNVPVSIKVNSGELPQDTDFDLYLWLNDFDGAFSSDVVHVLNRDTQKDSDPTFHTPDETPPIVSNVMQTNFDLPDAIEFSFVINEAPSTLYWAVVAETNETFIKSGDDLTSLGIKLKVEFGTGAIVSGKKDAAGADVTTEVKAADFAGKLKYSDYNTHNFKLYYVAKDAAGNYSEVKFIIIHTLDNDPPTVTLKFSDAMYNTDADKAAGRVPRPQSDSDLILVFSEQVKGDSSEGADTFVELYNEVAAYKELVKNDPVNSGYRDMLDYYKNVLAEELEKHITLYYVQSRQDVPLAAPKRDSSGNIAPKDAQELYGWIDFREAIVTLEKDGTVLLTLPGGEGGAVQLGGGMEYYFRFTDVYDDSYTANLLVRKDSDGKIIDGGEFDNTVDLEHFTTVYAQVWLEEDESGIAKIEASETDDHDLDDLRLDMVVNVTPQSIGNTDSKDCWDLIIWSDVRVEFEVYRRVNGGKWEQVTGKIELLPNLGASLSYNKLSEYVSNNENVRYETVTAGLEVGMTYQYGIHFTSVGHGSDADEDVQKRTEDPVAWSDLVTMRFSAIAGPLSFVQNIAGSVSGNYDNLVYTRGVVYEIGSVRAKTASGSATETILQVERQFTDKRPPAFLSDSPTFTATSSTIEMNVYLTRTGTLYYVVAPAERFRPTITEGDKVTQITSASDGSDTIDKDGYVNETTSERNARVAAEFGSKADKTYIPISGTDRQSNKKYIYFMTGVSDDEGAKYSAPSYGQIFDGQNAYKDYSDIVTAGTYPYTAQIGQTIKIEHLQPKTWYYVYVVLRSDSGTFDEVVQVYRVKTSDVTPPSITINPNGTTAVTMTVNDRNSTNTRYDNPMLYYALIRKDDLPTVLTGKFEYTPKTGENRNDKVNTVLDAIITKYGSTGRSYFDEYASEALKNEVMQLVTIATGSNTYGSSIIYFGPRNENEWATKNELKDYMEMGGEYVLVACARHFYSKEEDGKEYGFAAAQGLYLRDEDPPVLTSGTGLQPASIQSVYYSYGSTKEVPGWGRMPNLSGYAFSGSISVSFDKAIYTYDPTDNVLKQIVATSTALTTDQKKTMIDIKEVINNSGKIQSVSQSGNNRTFTIKFEKMLAGEVISFPALYNSSGVMSPYTLTLTFRPATTQLQTMPPNLDSFLGDIWDPSFDVSWRLRTTS